MSIESDPEFSMLLGSPDAYHVHQEQLNRRHGESVPTPSAHLDCAPGADELAGALNIVKRARRAARGAGRLAKSAGREAVKTGPLSLSVRATKLAARGLAAATGPLRRKIFRAFFSKLINRRARFLSWKTRRSLQPTARDVAAARTWAVRYVKRRGLLGRLLGASLSGDRIGEPATTALVTASIPVLIQLARKALRSAERQGAPADPRDAAPQSQEQWAQDE